MKILIETIPHSEQRYPTVGDWQFLPQSQFGTGKADLNPDMPFLRVRVSELSDWRYEALVGLHEAIEALLCKSDGVTEQQVDEFDLKWEKARAINHVDGEPGNSPDAPYNHQHESAELIERTIARLLRVDWRNYSKEVDNL